MTDAIRVMLEIGPTGKKVVAVAPDWSGLARGAKTEEAARARQLAYLPRYTPVAADAGMATAFAPPRTIEVVVRYPGNGFTDFWGSSFACSDFDRQPITTEDLERGLRLLRGWALFDDVRGRVAPELRKGPRGGRDRDQIVRHMLISEQDWTRKIGIPPSCNPSPDLCRPRHAPGRLL